MSETGFMQIVGAVFSGFSVLLALFAMSKWATPTAPRYFGYSMIVTLAAFADHWSVYILATVIVATTVAQPDFLRDIVALIVQNYPYWKGGRPVESTNVQPEAEQANRSTPTTVGQRPIVEQKILNTLWIKQVNRFDDWPESRWMFRPGSDDPYWADFVKASDRLAREGLVICTQDRMVYMTDHGFEYCRDHNQELGTEHWWADEQLDQEKLEKVSS